MRDSKSRKDQAKPALAATAPSRPVGPEILRRLLLGFITALIVARPLVLGEDPGLLLKSFTDASSLVLTYLWLVGAAVWALWRAWTGRNAWTFGAIDGGLLGVVVGAFLSAAFSAAYKHPAWIIAWEWLALFLA